VSSFTGWRRYESWPAVVWPSCSVAHMWMAFPRHQSLCWRQFIGTDAIQRRFSPWMWLIGETNPINWSASLAVWLCKWKYSVHCQPRGESAWRDGGSRMKRVIAVHSAWPLQIISADTNCLKQLCGHNGQHNALLKLRATERNCA